MPDTPAIAPNQAISPEHLKPVIRYAAQKYQLDEVLLTSMIKAESNFNPRAISPKGAKGLMQLMPETVTLFKVKNVFDAKQNIEAGAKYLKDLLAMFNQDEVMALAAYNAGPTTVTFYKGIPPFPETQEYIRRILTLRQITQ
jgi:soluble lytic murein transglycosylase-like protein